MVLRRISKASIIGLPRKFETKLIAFPHCSIDKVSKVKSPVLVIHGTDDEVIDFSHGIGIYERCPKAVEPLWVEVSRFGSFRFLFGRDTSTDTCECVEKKVGVVGD